MKSLRLRGTAAENPREIIKIRARQVLDSRGNPTVEADVWTSSGFMGRAAVPSGASTGRHEALELRDGVKNAFGGMGVMKAVSNINTLIGPRLVGMDCGDQPEIDHLMIELDGTVEKRRLGANSILAVSMATARATSAVHGKWLFRYLRPRERYRLPVPMMNVINGGKHAGNGLSIQEFLIEPVGAKSFHEAVQFGAEVYHALKPILQEKYGPYSVNVGDEGGYAPPLYHTHDALDVIVKAINKAGFTTDCIKLGLDPASTSFYDEKNSVYRVDGKNYTAGELEDFYLDLVSSYPILTLEDPFHEEAFSDFSSITKKLKGKAIVIGDDLYVTNSDRIRRGTAEKASNAVLIKLNQVGSVTETLEAIRASEEGGLATVISHRSGETEDVFISHLATAVESAFIKSGAPARGERVAKYNELLRIEEELGHNADFRPDFFPGRAEAHARL